MTPSLRSVFALLPALACLPLCGQPVLQELRNPAMANAGTAPGAILVLKGSGFAQDTRVAAVPPLPKELAGARVLLEGIECPLLFVSPDTIHAQLPFGITSQRSSFNVFVKVRTPEGDSGEIAIPLGDTQPVLLTESRDGKGKLVLVDEKLTPVRSPRDGNVVLFYAMGLGETDPPATSGWPAPADPLLAVKLPVEVLVGDQPAEVLSAGLAPGSAGLYQVKIRMPVGGGTTLRLRTENGAREQAADLPAVEASGKVTDVSGEIDAAIAIPTTGPPGFSPVLAAAAFSVSMTVAPKAEPFDITMGGAAANVNITVKPASMSFEGTAAVPTVETRMGDFSRTTLRATDFFAGGLPFPGNIIPRSRWPPQYEQAIRLMPMPGEPGSQGSGTGIVRFSGRIPGDGRLVLNSGTAPALAAAGAWVSVADKSAKSLPVTFRLVVDGQEISKKDIAIPVQ